MEIDYDFELMMFKSKTNVEDDDVAYQYLNKNGWDSELAAAAYFKTLDSNISKEDNKSKPIKNEKNQIKKEYSFENDNRHDNFFSNSGVNTNKSNGNYFHRELCEILPLAKEANFDTVRRTFLNLNN